MGGDKTALGGACPKTLSEGRTTSNFDIIKAKAENWNLWTICRRNSLRQNAREEVDSTLAGFEGLSNLRKRDRRHKLGKIKKHQSQRDTGFALTSGVAKHGRGRGGTRRTRSKGKGIRGRTRLKTGGRIRSMVR